MTQNSYNVKTWLCFFTSKCKGKKAEIFLAVSTEEFLLAQFFQLSGGNFPRINEIAKPNYSDISSEKTYGRPQT